ncbi:MAG: hypothetical protein HKN47_11560 [Pirellulaceae bacterium]|nr:hypothetical protein [Pirellulaceae bacterium]
MRRDELNLPEPPSNDRPGDRWMCGSRSESACANGPSRKGKCPLADACRPKKTWNGRRRNIVISILAVCVFAIALTLQQSVTPKVFKPGELSTPHAQILASTLTSDRCAACHRSASLSPENWFDSAAEGHAGVSQTDRCLDCHHRTIRRDSAKFAHNLPPQRLSEIKSRIRLASSKTTNSWHDRLPGPAIDQNDVDCAACHREHRGAEADLMAVSDAQCQTCHSDRFGSFATSHPDWNQWPYGRGGNIAFDHQSHMMKHFPAATAKGMSSDFACNRCHNVTADHEITRSVSYEVGCQSCHDDALRLESAKGIELLALPTLPSEQAATLADTWPDQATGMVDGVISPLSELLLRPDQKASDAIRRLPHHDLSRIQTGDAKLLDALTAVATGHRTLLQEFATEGQPAIVRRAKAAGVSAESMRELLRTLPPQLIDETYRKWFGSGDASKSNRSGITWRLSAAGIAQVDYVEMSDSQSNPSILLPLQSDEDVLFGVERIAPVPDGSTRAGDLSDLEYVGDLSLLNEPSQPQQNPAGVESDAMDSVQMRLTDQSADTAEPKGANPTQIRLSDSNMGIQDNTLSAHPNPTGNSVLIKRPESSGPAESGDSLGPETRIAMTDTGEELLGDSETDEELLADAGSDDGMLSDDLLGNDSLADDPLAVDALANDPLAVDPLANGQLANGPTDPKSTDKRFDPDAMMPHGGWYRDDVRMSIGYRGSGHSDPVLRSAVNMVHQLAPSDPVRKRLLSIQAVAACVDCHKSDSPFSHSWHSQALVGRKSEFTKFRHAPHMNVSQLSDCKHCHQVNTNPPRTTPPIHLASFRDAHDASNESDEQSIDSGHPPGHDFLPMKRQACAACHTARAAGDSCIDCHRYHIQPQSRLPMAHGR